MERNGDIIVKRNGFTLIELLVVISVIVLLIALLLSALRRARNHARAAICQTNLKQWGSTLELYAHDNEGRFPSGGLDTMMWILSGRYVGFDNPDEPREYHSIQTEGIALCPMAARRSIKTGAGTMNITYQKTPTGPVTLQVLWRNGSTFSAWEIISFSPLFRCSYGLNHALFPREPYYPERHAFYGDYYPYLYSIRNVAGIPVLADSVSPSGRPIDDFTFGKPPPTDSGLNTGYWPFCINRHNEHINMLFLDWSVRKVGLKELWTLRWSPGFNTAGPWTKAGGVRPDDWPEWIRGFKDY
jgi:prepilin-type N-terminal cleavage/methylation domain-containing protein/prepilin-type processing-associated H-X9-DG protein